MNSVIQIGECWRTSGPSFLGLKVYTDNVSYFHFINEAYDTLHIKYNAVKDENWLFYIKPLTDLKIIASIDTIIFDSLLVIPDSVKIIKFIAQNLKGENVNHPINSRIVQISKNYGFSLLFNFLQCPNNISNFRLLGIKNLNKGYRDISVAEIWDMEVGDEFHFLDRVQSSSCPSSTYYIKKVIGKRNEGSILKLDFAEWKFFTAGVLCSGMDSVYPLRQYTEVINPNDPLTNRWSTSPGVSYAAENYAGYYDIYSSINFALQEKRHSAPPLYTNDPLEGCYHQQIEPWGINGYYYAIRGAGGYYFRGTYSGGYGAIFDFSLIYSRKSNSTYGNPFDYGKVMGWLPFVTNRTFFWGRNPDIYIAMAEQQINFIKTSANDFKTPFSTIGLSDQTCWKTDKIGIFGKEILTDYKGTYTLINRFNDSIVFKPYTPIDTEWLFYTNQTGTLNVKARCSSSESTYIYGSIFDSIRSFSFQAYDANGMPVNHPVNEKEIVLSKKNGFLSTFDFYYFPDPLSSVDYKLNGYTDFQSGAGTIRQNLTLDQVYDMNIGDRVDIITTSHFEGGYTVTETIRYLLNMTGNTQSILELDFRVLRKTATYYTQGDSIVEYLQDTIRQSIDFGNSFTAEFNKEIGNLTQLEDGYHTMRLKVSSQKYSGKLVKEIKPFIYNKYPADSCYYTDTTECTRYYIEGMGGPYEYCSGNDNRKFDEVVYFQSGNSNWGSPLNVSDILGKTESSPDKPTIFIYPNPVDETIVFSLQNRPSQNLLINIYDGRGLLLISIPVTDKKTKVNVKNLNPGIYFYKINTDTIEGTGKFIKK